MLPTLYYARYDEDFFFFLFFCRHSPNQPTHKSTAKLVNKIIPAKSLSAFQRRDLIKDTQKRAEAEIAKVVTGADAPAALRLLFHDAATYNAVTKTGGVNGSVVLSEELNRPENKDLKNLVDRLSTARKAFAEKAPKGQNPLSWADTLVLAVKVTQEINWRADKIAKNPKNGEYIAESFSNPIIIKLGRKDASSPDPAVPFPGPGASADQVLEFSKTFGVKDPSAIGGPLSRKAPFWERVIFVLWTAAQPNPEAAEKALVEAAPEAFGPWKEKYDRSRKTTFRQDYEIDFIDYLNKLADLTPAPVNPSYYFYDVTIQVPDRL